MQRVETDPSTIPTVIRIAELGMRLSLSAEIPNYPIEHRRCGCIRKMYSMIC